MNRSLGGIFTMGWIRFLYIAFVIVIGITVVAIFLNLFLKIAAMLFLVAFAYYWFMKALRLRKDNRHW
jgi:hypothetical protein